MTIEIVLVISAVAFLLNIITQVNEKTDEEADIEGLNVVRWEWRGTYTGNIT